MDDFLHNLLYYSYQVLRVYLYVMILTIILSWTPLRNSRFYQLLEKITSVYLGMFRGWLTVGMMDITPFVGLLLYQLILSFIGRAI